MKPEELWDARWGADHIDVVVQSADVAWLTWEITAQSMDACRLRLGRQWPQARLTLRVSWKPQHGGVQVLDLPLERWQGERFVPLGAPGHVHHCTIGLLAPDSAGGVFMAIARSAPFVSPRNTPAPKGEVVWTQPNAREERS